MTCPALMAAAAQQRMKMEGSTGWHAAEHEHSYSNELDVHQFAYARRLLAARGPGLKQRVPWQPGVSEARSATSTKVVTKQWKPTARGARRSRSARRRLAASGARAQPTRTPLGGSLGPPCARSRRAPPRRTPRMPITIKGSEFWESSY